MDENLHDIDKLFRDPIEEHEEMPSAKVWDAIDNNLDKSNVISIKKKYNNLKRLAVALLLLLLGTIAYEIQTKRSGGNGVAINSVDPGNPVESKNTGSNKNENINANNTAVNNTGDQEGSAADNYSTTNALKNTDDKKSTLELNSIKDSLNNSTADIVKNIKDKKNVAIENTDKKARTKSAKDKTLPVVNNGDRNNAASESGSNLTASENIKKPVVKKSSQYKTKITVRHTEDEDAAAVNDLSDNGLNNNATAATELKPLQNYSIEKITSDEWRKDKSFKTINGDRNTVETNIKNSVVKNKSTKSTRPFHFSLTPFYSPQFSFNRLEDDHHDPGPQPRNGREQIKKEEQRVTSSSMGILFDVALGKNWGLQSGVTYVNRETEIEPKKIFAKVDNDGKVKYRFDCASGYTYISTKTGAAPAVGDSVSAAASTNTLKYIGVPFALNYNFSIGKFSIIPTVGAVANFLVKQQIETTIIQGTSKENQTINNIQGLKSSYLNAFTGVALEYNVNKKIALSIMPSGNFALSSINKDAAVKSYPNSFGLTGGIKIKF